MLECGRQAILETFVVVVVYTAVAASARTLGAVAAMAACWCRLFVMCRPAAKLPFAAARRRRRDRRRRRRCRRYRCHYLPKLPNLSD